MRKSAFRAKVEERVNRDICMSCGMSDRSPSSCMNENMTRVPLYCSSGLDAEGCRWIHSHAKHLTYQDAGLAKVRLTFGPIKSCVLLTGMAYGMQFACIAPHCGAQSLVNQCRPRSLRSYGAAQNFLGKPAEVTARNTLPVEDSCQLLAIPGQKMHRNLGNSPDILRIILYRLLKQLETNQPPGASAVNKKSAQSCSSFQDLKEVGRKTCAHACGRETRLSVLHWLPKLSWQWEPQFKPGHAV